MNEQDTIWVKCATADGKVCLWDRHPDHPDGEAFVAGDTAALVAQTPAVVTALGQGRIVKTSAPKRKQPVAAAVVPAGGEQPNQASNQQTPPGGQQSTPAGSADPNAPAGTSKETDPNEGGGAAPDDPEAAARELRTNLGDDLADKLAAGGFTTPVTLMTATDAQLLGVPGVGDAMLKKIRELYPQVILD